MSILAKFSKKFFRVEGVGRYQRIKSWNFIYGKISKKYMGDHIYGIYTYARPLGGVYLRQRILSYVCGARAGAAYVLR
jgi:hypothetical protein